MTARRAACSCEQLRLTAEGEPVRISVCHCLACQRRTGSAFGVQARFPVESVRIEGRYREYVRISDEGEGRTFSFCPECGATVFYKTESEPEDIVVPVGAFADPGFPEPRMSVWEKRRHPWVDLPTLAQGSRHLHYDQQLRAEMSGQLRLRVRYRDYATPWFDYLIASSEEREALVDGTGWRVGRVIPGETLYERRGQVLR